MMTRKKGTSKPGDGDQAPRAGIGPGLDWAAGHGPITGALSATTGCAAIATLGAAAGMPWGWPALIGAAGALGHGIGASVYRRMTATTMRTRAASWLLAGGWTSWAVHSGPLSWTAAGTLAGLGVGVGAMASTAAIHEEAAELEARDAEVRALVRDLGRERAELAAEWQARIKRVCGVELQILAIESWPNGAGYGIDAKLPGGRTTWKVIAQYADALASDAELELGCTIAVTEGIRQGRVILDVTTRPVMREDIPYPDDLSPLSILTGIPWGVLPDSHPVMVYLRESGTVVIGPPGSGKSTFMDAVLAGFARCIDVVTWVIDLKGGAIGLPWVRPWLEAQGHLAPLGGGPRPLANTRPGVDWVASTLTEARLMLRAALAVNEFRQRHYQDLMARHDTTLLPVSARLPQIQIVVDEGAELLSLAGMNTDPLRKEVAGLLLKVKRTTRAMAIRDVLTAVDGNVSALSDTQVLKFSPVRIVLTSASTGRANVDKLFPGLKLDAGQLTARGAGVIGATTAEGFDPTAFKGWKTSPNWVASVVLGTNATRPALDGPSAKHLGEVYARRWDADRAGWMWQHRGTAGTADSGTGGARPGGLNLSAFRNSDTPAPPPRTPQPPSGQSGLNLSAFRNRDEADALAEALSRAIDETYGTTDEPDTAPNTPTPGPSWITDAVEAIRAAGPVGIGPGALADLLGKDRKTVRATLKPLVDRGELAYVDNGPKSAYVHPDHA